MHYDKIVEKLKQRREVLEITQEHLSELAGIGKRTLNLIETGKGNPTLSTLLKLTEVLGMEFDLKVKQPR
jgi:transcriptional regulator with XRE-family HTH domain